MVAYIFRRIALILPTLFGIMILNFLIVQIAPGGPIEHMIANLQGTAVDATARIGGTGTGDFQSQMQTGQDALALSQGDPITSRYRGAQGLDPEFLRQLEREFGFDKPFWERFLTMMGRYAQFDFGKSYFRDTRVVDLIIQKMPVSISLGLWTTLLIYIISIPLGIAKAVRDGSRFDIWSSTIVIIGYAIPGFLFAVLLIVLFAGGRYWSVFPLRGLVSDHWATLSTGAQIRDYLWHVTLPVLSLVIGGFASLTMLTKNSFLDEIRKQYIITAKAKGLTERQVLYGHIFRNAMLIVIAGFPGAFIHILFTGALLVEVIFSLDGLGLLGFEATVNRDYPIMFATLYMFTLLGLILNLVGDITYMLVDPRIGFEANTA